MTERGRSPGVLVAGRLPSWLGSVRFRLAALYSIVLLGLAALVVAGIYAGVARSLDDETVYRVYDVNRVVLTPEGRLEVRPETVRQELRSLEQVVNEQALADLRRYSFAAIGILFLASLAVGWVVAGVVLRPIGDITAVAREITATDLSRRIALGGADDELRQLADTFDDMLARLEVAFRDQQRFVQDASHELRNPLAVMRTSIDVALADPDVDVAELRRIAEVVGRTVDRMSALVDDLLRTARHEPIVRPSGPVDLADLVRAVAAEHEAAASGRGVALSVDAVPGAVVAGDAVALAQAVTNLVDNAVRLSPSGGTVSIRVQAAGDGWDVVVADQGPGVPAELRATVFDRFHRGAAPTAGSTGLGLAIVRAVAEGHGGTATCEGEPGDGATFRLHLPAGG